MTLPANSSPQRSRSEALFLIACAVVPVLAVLLCTPNVEMGANDDWSYIKIAWNLALTGKLMYNGWSSPMQGVLAYWTAFLIKQFGFSFTLARLAQLPFVALSGPLLYDLHRRSRISPPLSLIGALTVTLSPLLIPNAATYMSDSPGLCFLLLSIYGYVRAMEGVSEAPRAATTIAWLVFGTVAGLLGGSIRQLTFLAPIFVPIYFVVTRPSLWRRHRFVPLALLCCSAIGMLVAVGLVRWMLAQPFTLDDKVSEGIRDALHMGARAVIKLFGYATRMLFTTAVVTLSVFAVALPAFMAFLRRESASRRAGIAGAIVALGVVEAVALRREWHFPWLGNSFGPHPWITEHLTPDLYTMPKPLTLLLSVAAILAANAALVTGVLLLQEFLRQRKVDRDLAPVDATTLFAEAFLAFALPYLGLMLFKPFVPDAWGILDRYTLLLMPLVTIATLRFAERERPRGAALAAAGAIIGLFGYYTVAQTHDYFAQLRARVTQYGVLTSAHVALPDIADGFENDGWQQISGQIGVNEPRLKNPADFYHPFKPDVPHSDEKFFWFSSNTPVIRYRYLVTPGVIASFPMTDVPPVPFHCWLPPFTRHVYVQTTDASDINVLAGNPPAPDAAAFRIADHVH